MTLEEKIGQVVICRYSGHFVNRDSDYLERLESLIVKQKIGGLVVDVKIASNLLVAAKIILEEGQNLITNSLRGLRTVVEALISAGVASCIAESSRPCSGSEHLFSHAVEYVAGKNSGLHGERVGIGTIMMAKLHGIDWEKIAETLALLGAPITGKQINLTERDVIQSLVLAGSLRPERFTILNMEKLNKNTAANLAKKVKVI